MQALQLFTDKKVGNMRCYIDESNTIYFSLEDSVNGLGFVTYDKKGTPTIMWDIVRKLLKSFDYKPKVKADDFIPENIFYLLAMRADNPFAIKFQKWIGNEVIPSIRKTGGYSVGEVPKRQAVRLSQVKVRKDATGIYEMYIVYAKKQGDKRDRGRIYAKFSKLANNVAGIPHGCRELANAKQLKICAMAEEMIARILTNGIAANLHYKEIEENVLSKGAEMLQLTAGQFPLLR